MASELTRLRDQLLDGRGFEVIRGLPVADIGDEHAQAAMVVLSAHVGGFRPQNSVFAQRFGSVTPGDRGGISATNVS